MTKWVYAGYTKIHSSDRRHMVEQWDWKCSKCGYTVRKAFGNQHMPKEDCPKCIQQHAFETAVEMLDIQPDRRAEGKGALEWIDI